MLIVVDRNTLLTYVPFAVDGFSLWIVAMNSFTFAIIASGVKDALPILGGALLIGSKIVESIVDKDKKAKEKEELFKEFAEWNANQKKD